MPGTALPTVPHPSPVPHADGDSVSQRTSHPLSHSGSRHHQSPRHGGTGRHQHVRRSAGKHYLSYGNLHPFPRRDPGLPGGGRGKLCNVERDSSRDIHSVRRSAGGLRSEARLLAIGVAGFFRNGHVRGFGAPWFQAQGGDVYANTSIRSYIPPSASPRYFVTNGPGGYPGVVAYSASYDFNSAQAWTGRSYVSETGWLVDDSDTSRDYYAIMYHRFGSPSPTATGDRTLTQKPAKRSAPYYYDGTVTIDTADWTVANGEKLVVFISGDLIIKRKIRINAGGFAVLIVNGSIVVDPSVGGAVTSTTPALEGVYITSPTGSFISGQSTNAGTERLVVEGTVIAGDVELQRDLESAGANNTTPAELFLYNPELLLTMPDEMRDLPVAWQEVAP